MISTVKNELGNNFSRFLTYLPSMDAKDESNSSQNVQKTLPVGMQFSSRHIISISAYSVLFFLSAIGNLTILTAILRKHNRRSLSRMSLLLMHLAIADLMVTFFTMPLEIGWAATVEWKAGDGLCRLMAFFRIFGLYLSGFVLVCLALDRYLAVRHPLRGMASTKRVKRMIAVAWTISTICSVPQMFIFHVERHPVYDWYTQCVTFNAFPAPQYQLLYDIFVMIMIYILPFILLVVLHGSISMHMRKLTRSTNIAFRSTDGLRRIGSDNIERARVRSTKMAFVITAAFLICWTPYYFMCVWYWVDPESAKLVDQRVQQGLFLFGSTTSAVNPLVYGMFHTKSIFGRYTSQHMEANV